MRHLLQQIVFISLIFSFSMPMLAEDIVLEFEDVRINKGTNNNATAYMHIINFSETQSVSLNIAKTNAAHTITLHKAPNKGIHIDAGDAFNMQEDNIHLRLENLIQVIHEGDVIPLELTFAHGETYIVDATVVKPGTHIHEDDSGDNVIHDNH